MIFCPGLLGANGLLGMSAFLVSQQSSEVDYLRGALIQESWRVHRHVLDSVSRQAS